MELEGSDLLEGPRSDEVGESSEPAQRASMPGDQPNRQICHFMQLASHICLWYVFSVGLTLYNKWLFAVFGFKFPLLTTAYHFCLKWPLARLGMWVLCIPALPLNRPLIGIWLRVVPTGATTALDVALSNLSLLYITVTYYTIVKSSVPLWILGFSVCLGLQRLRWQMIFVLGAIATGIVLASAGLQDRSQQQLNQTVVNASDMSFEISQNLSFLGVTDHASWEVANVTGEATMEVSSKWLGLLLVLGASFCAGFRWACTQLLLQSLHAVRAINAAIGYTEPTQRTRHPKESRSDRNPLGAVDETNPHHTHALHPLSLMYAFSPFACLILLPFALLVECSSFLSYFYALEATEIIPIVFLVSSGALLGFLLILAELRVVQLSSGLTLSVAGIFKEVVTIAASAIVLGDHLTRYNVLGLLLCLVGILFYTLLMHADGLKSPSNVGGPTTSTAMNAVRPTMAEGSQTAMGVGCTSKSSEKSQSENT